MLVFFSNSDSETSMVENPSVRARENPKMNTMKQNYRNLHRDWAIFIFESFIVSYFGSSYKYF